MRYGSDDLDYIADELDLKEGMSVVLFYEDPSDAFEVNAILGAYSDPSTGVKRWRAKPMSSFRSVGG